MTSTSFCMIAAQTQVCLGVEVLTAMQVITFKYPVIEQTSALLLTWEICTSVPASESNMDE